MTMAPWAREPAIWLSTTIKNYWSSSTSPTVSQVSTSLDNNGNDLTSRRRSSTDDISAIELAWNDLKKSSLDIPQYTLQQVSEHSSYHDCWIVIYDRVYDVTDFLHSHPGGDYVIGEHAGADATYAFRSSRHGKDAFDMMEKYCIGILVPQERIYTPTDEQLLSGP